MKAKEYSEIFNKAEDKDQAIRDICNGFLRETKELISKRKIGTESGLNGVLREQKQKWIAVARQTGVLKEDGYELLMKNRIPEIGRYF